MRRLFNTKIKRAAVLIMAFLTITGVFAMSTFASGSVEPIDILADYCIYSEYRANDGYIGIPVGICTYTKEAKADSSSTKTEVVFYVMNYNDNGQNLSNEDDLPIICDLLDDGNIVVTLDYYNNSLACNPALTYSVQNIKTGNAGSLSTILRGYSFNDLLKRVLPSGYRVARELVFFDLVKNAPKGVKESTVNDAWNSSGFQTVYNNARKNNSDMPEYQKLESYEKLYKPDGSPIDSRMRLDVSYPSRPITNDVPVICWASSEVTKTGNHVSKVNRPHDSEALFRGYAFAVYDHGYYPMARDDHYGYFFPYGVQDQVGIQYHSAAIRCIRYYSYLFGYGIDNYGGFGHSKSALVASLANPHPELLSEVSTFSKYEYYPNEKYGDQPYQAYKDSDETIASNLQFCYSSMGLGVEYHYKYHNASTSPMFTASGISDQHKQWEFWAEQLNTFNQSGSNYIGISFLDKGHEYVYGENAVYGFDEFDLAFDYIDYFLKDDIAPRVSYFTTDVLAEVTTDGGVSVQFTGSISEASVKKGVTLTDNTLGRNVEFLASSTGNGSKWTFYAKDGFVEGHTYTLNIGDTVAGANGVAIRSAESTSFECTNLPKVIACSADLFDNSISYYSTVGFQFSAPMDSMSLKQNCTVLRKITTKITNLSTGETTTDVKEEYITPVFEVVGDKTLWTVSSSTNPTNKWGDTASTTTNGITTSITYDYTITIGAGTCSTSGAMLGEDFVTSFRTN